MALFVIALVVGFVVYCLDKLDDGEYSEWYLRDWPLKRPKEKGDLDD